ncbi:MAG: DUF4412 domain-containing protein [Verrucomicrobiia bacterium]|jgi:hypothetical protein
MAKILGNNQACTAIADISFVDAQHGTPVEMQASLAFLKGNVRTDTDWTSMKGTKIPPELLALMKQFGMDRGVTICRGDKKVIYIMFPRLKSYMELSPSQGPQADKTDPKEPKLDVTQTGKDTVDGHPCVENKITFTADDGTQHEMLAWQATDINNFPIKTEEHVNGAITTTHYSNVKLSAPDASLFDPPSDFTKYSSIQEMMTANMQRMMPPGAGQYGGGN